ncbi:MAG: hypothetical protein GY710_03845 [Desulfobacteraceae bacterium]|nr:hypothetical protein [Desulfobacteraceae bacterium]
MSQGSTPDKKISLKAKLKNFAELIPVIGKYLAFLIDLLGYRVALILAFGIILGVLLAYGQIIYKKGGVPSFAVKKIEKHYCGASTISKIEVVPWAKPKQILYPAIKLLPDPNTTTLRLEGLIERQLIAEGTKKINQSIDDFHVLQAIYDIKNKRGEFEFVGQVDRKLKCSLSGEAFLYKSGTGFKLFEHLLADKQRRTLKFKINNTQPGDKIVAIIKIEKEKGAGMIGSPKKTIDWFAQ